MSRLLTPRTGQVVLDGKDLHRLPTKEVARTLGLLPQSPIAPEGIVVGDLVARGRHPHQRMLSRWTAADDAAVAEALELTGTTDLADRAVDELSGGQRQRVWIAMALAQQTDILLLDEPTTFLDVTHQVEVLDLLTDLNRTRGTTIVMVLHDLNLAARYADHLIAVAEGRVYAAGDPAEVLTADRVAGGLRPAQPGDPRSRSRASRWCCRSAATTPRPVSTASWCALRQSSRARRHPHSSRRARSRRRGRATGSPRAACAGSTSSRSRRAPARSQ